MHGGQYIHSLEKNNKSLSDFHVFNLETFQWKKLFIMEGPSARDKHDIVKIGSAIYIYGGCVSPEQTKLNDLWRFDFDSVSWFSKQSEVVGATIDKIDQRNEGPGKICGHKMVVSNDEESFVLFGGLLDSGETQNTLWFFNTMTCEWR
jgi:hypothetical protein